jgi:hypothetical protein
MTLTVENAIDDMMRAIDIHDMTHMRAIDIHDMTHMRAIDGMMRVID